MSLMSISKSLSQSRLVFALAILFSAATAPSPALQAAEDVAAPLAVTADALWAASFKDLTGTAQSLSTYKGKTALIYFWATWCEPCQKEGPAFQALYEKFKDKNFVVVGIAVDNADKVREFVKAHGMAFPIVYGGSDAIKLSKDIGNSLGGIPFLVVIDRDGKIVERITGEAKDGRIEGIITPLVAN